MTTPKPIRDLNAWLARWFPVNYDRYLQSRRWRSKAEACKKRALYQCQGCGRPQGIVRLSAHHRTYVRLGYEIPEDLTALCQDCHPAIQGIKHRAVAGYRPPATGWVAERSRQAIYQARHP